MSDCADEPRNFAEPGQSGQGSTSHSKGASGQISPAELLTPSQLPDVQQPSVSFYQSTYERSEIAEGLSARPPYVWARDLYEVLNDGDAAELFQTYLLNESGEGSFDLLDFWYACKALQNNAHAAEQLKMYAPMIYNAYLRPANEQQGLEQAERFITYVRPETRNEIAVAVEGGSVHAHMMDAAQAEIEAILATHHRAFVSSDVYINFVNEYQRGSDSVDETRVFSVMSVTHSDTSSSHSGSLQDGASSTRQSLTLRTVHEHSATTSAPSESTAASECGTQTETPTVAPSKSEKPAEQPPSLPPRKVLGPSSNKQRPAVPPKPGGKSTSSSHASSVPGPSAKQIAELPTAANLKKTLESRRVMSKKTPSSNEPPHPYHTPYVPVLPTSAQDSDRQSSDADTYAGSSSGTSDLFRLNLPRRHHRQFAEMLRRNAAQNGPVDTCPIPRTGHTSNQPMIDPSDRVRFAQELCSKLEQLKREKENNDQFNQQLRELYESSGASKDNARQAIFNHIRKNPSSSAVNGDTADGNAVLDRHVALFDSGKNSPIRSPNGTHIILQGGQLAPAAHATSSTAPPVHATVRAVAGSAARRKSPKTRSPGSKSPDRRSQANPAAAPNSRMVSSFPNPASSSWVAPPTSHLARSRVQNQTSMSSASATLDRKPRGEHGSQGRKASPSTFSSGTNSSGTVVSMSSGFVSGDSAYQPLPPATLRATGAQPPAARSTGSATGSSSSTLRTSRGSKLRAKQVPSESFVAEATSRRHQPFFNADFSQSFSTTAVDVIYYLSDESTPYMTRVACAPGQITLKRFKQSLSRRGKYKYFFKREDPTLEVVWQEVHNDADHLPTFRDKVVAKVVDVPAESSLENSSLNATGNTTASDPR